MPTKVVYKTLSPIRETTGDWDNVERELKRVWRKELYEPLLKILGYTNKTLANAKGNALIEALKSGRITFYRGEFSGRLSAGITKSLRAIGARWDARTRTYKLPSSSLPIDIRHAVSVSENRFNQKMDAIDRKLTQILPADISDKASVGKFFDRALWRVEKDFEKSIENISVAPTLSDEERRRIAGEWANNMKLWVQDFTKKQITQLRKDVQASVFKGNRYESIIGEIKKSYDVSENKAKFLARQETSLLMTKYKETRYQQAGVNEYEWRCVAGSKNHPVRPWHKSLEGKIFKFDNPPITTKPGESVRRNNPGQDYNCRCFAKPVVRVNANTFKK